MVDWLRRRANRDEHPQSEPKAAAPNEEPTTFEGDTTEDLVDRTPEPEEPADGFSEAGIREAL
ncbi:MAG: hypothetical protein M3318_06050, partial [Actinomycetota bacterium]|nr:hypothetical protein [Actinomycetota bacterium]